MSFHHYDETRLKIDAIDLTNAKAKLLKEKGWLWRRRHDIRQLEEQYKNFLYKIAKNPGKIFRPPSQAMDDLWHMHILHTKQYREDCMRAIGCFVHHYPDETTA